MQLLKKITDFLKKEIVFTVALILAIISTFFVPINRSYISYIDFRTLALLLALMYIVQGLIDCHFFDLLVCRITASVKNRRMLAFIMISVCYFSSMLITNDVALITFVPFTIILLNTISDSGFGVYLIVLETIAANLGSMLTPIGNPQNLYIYSISGFSIGKFIMVMLPYSLAAYVLLMLAILPIKKLPLIADHNATGDTLNKPKFIVNLILFALAICTVIHIIDYRLLLIIVFVITAIINYRLIFKADYILLLTFIAFFIFIGNMKQIEAFSDYLSGIVDGHEFFVSIAASQAISNVPCAMLLSGFTTNFEALLVGLNFGGLGTLIASMASLISYKFFANFDKKNKGKYLLTFTLMNIIILTVLIMLYIMIK